MSMNRPLPLLGMHSIDSSRRILKYDLATREINVHLQPPGSYRTCTTIMTVEDGGLGVARMEGPRLPVVNGGDGLFSFDLKSGQVRNVCEAACYFNSIRGVVPSMSFHTPGVDDSGVVLLDLLLLSIGAGDNGGVGSVVVSVVTSLPSQMILTSQ